MANLNLWKVKEHSLYPVSHKHFLVSSCHFPMGVAGSVLERTIPRTIEWLWELLVSFFSFFIRV